MRAEECSSTEPVKLTWASCGEKVQVGRLQLKNSGSWSLTSITRSVTHMLALASCP